MELFSEDTIAAISTPLGEGGIGIVRLSGPEAVKVAERLFISPKVKKLGNIKSHRVVYGFIYNPETNEKIDEVLVTVMRAPNTYTREDVVEINCHGGIAPLKSVLSLALRHGARLSEPGEFTKRAFLNGRIDLTQAEAVIDLIRAKTDKAEKVALEQLSGGLSEKIKYLREKLTDICVHIEAHIDFPEDEIETAAMGEIKTGVLDLIDGLSALSKTYDEGRFLREGVKAAIVGRPNVGKSSILNALLQRDRAIVTETPGTTRDVLEEYLNMNGLPVLIMDTAGIREAHDMVEKEGVRRSLKALDDADVVMAVLDRSVPIKGEDREVLGRVKGKNAIIILNKKDLPLVVDAGSITGGKQVVNLSAKTGEGLDELKSAIFNSCIKNHTGPEAGVIVTNLRHKAALDNSANALKRALYASDAGEPLEILAIELRDGLNFIGEIVGAVTAEDILNKIFGDFCIGK